MADKPILFSAPMVRAILEGRKTQTRRVAKVQWLGGANPAFTGWHPERISHLEWGLFCNSKGAEIKAQYAIGDRLWVREAWRTHATYDDHLPSEMGGEEPIRYEVDGYQETRGWRAIDRLGRYRHARFMPRWASRITLRITRVRVERLQEISEGDAIAEGIAGNPVTAWRCYAPEPKNQTHWADPRESFRTIWESIHGPCSWEANPWVAAYTFEPIFQNIDSIGGRDG